VRSEGEQEKAENDEEDAGKDDEHDRKV
jgi:hypothetical protein